MYSQRSGEWNDGWQETSSCGPCAACFLMLLGMVAFPTALFSLGIREQKAVCEERDIFFAEKNAQPVECSGGLTSQGQYVFFSCPVDGTSLAAIGPTSFGFTALADTLNLSTVVLSQSASVYQCQETEHTENRKVNGREESRKTYSYSMVWSDQPLTSSFHEYPDYVNRYCPGIRDFGGNPPWPAGLPMGTQERYSANVRLGSFLLADDLTQRGFVADVPVDLTPFAANFPAVPPERVPTTLAPGDLAPTGVPGELGSCAGPRLGCIRVRYAKNSATGASVTASIVPSPSGIYGLTAPMTMAQTWGCPSGMRSDIQPGLMALPEMVEKMLAEDREEIFITRLVCILLAWLALFCFMQPCLVGADLIGDVLDYIPICGAELEDIVETLALSVVCCCSCTTGLLASLIVIGVVWIVMRPVFGICLLLAAAALFVVGLVIRNHMIEMSSRKGQERDGGPRYSPIWDEDPRYNPILDRGPRYSPSPSRMAQ
mmetsp:Transcript_14805/g.32538  ORF Transcript_14805/g.32538 Transcript_14805/m.32538 type:complete len:487 (-) Transcript_14805:505-1965(-)